MIAGFTGTSIGMTEGQKGQLHKLLQEYGITVLHHGDCVGADAECHDICNELQIPVVLHPPTNPKKRAFCTAYRERPKKPYLDRNQDIVLESDILFAAVKKNQEEIRSGTWSTIRKAHKRGIPVIIIER